MKAIVVREFGAPEVMKLEDAPTPQPQSGQVVVRVHAVGVNPVDAYIRSGTYARKPQLPYTPGTDVGGTVETVGAGVTTVRPGDRVYVHAAIGGYAEYALCEDWQAHILPDHVSFEQGAAIGVPYATAWRALMIRAGARAGETVLVHGGSGGVGTAAIQIARARGMRVIATAGTDAGIALVREQGAHEVLNHRETGYLQQVMPLTGGQGVNVVLEMLANVNLDQDLDVLSYKGRVVVVGSRGRVEIDPRKTIGKDATILGMTLFNANREEFLEIHSGIRAGLENGTLKPVIGKVFPLAQAIEAQAAVMATGATGKVVIKP